MSKGFGFVDFDSIENAKLFMESTTGMTFISNNRVAVEYSTKAPKDNYQIQQQMQEKQHAQQPIVYKDWICVHVRFFSCFSLFAHTFLWLFFKVHNTKFWKQRPMLWL